MSNSSILHRAKEHSRKENTKNYCGSYKQRIDTYQQSATSGTIWTTIGQSLTLSSIERISISSTFGWTSRSIKVLVPSNALEEDEDEEEDNVGVVVVREVATTSWFETKVSDSFGITYPSLYPRAKIDFDDVEDDDVIILPVRQSMVYICKEGQY